MRTGESVTRYPAAITTGCPHSHVVVMFDEDEAGKAGRDDIATRLSKFCFVKVHVFDKPDMQPEYLTPEEVQQLFH